MSRTERMPRPRIRRTLIASTGVLTSCGMLASLAVGIVPAHAGSASTNSAPIAHTAPADAAHDDVSIAIGAGVDLLIDGQVGTVRLSSSTSYATWDSTNAADVRYPFPEPPLRPVTGRGVSWGAAYVYGTESGVPGVYVPGKGRFLYDNSTASGLKGYTGTDLRFRPNPGTLAARGNVGPRTYELTLEHFDTGVTDYLGGNGEVLASVGPSGARTDRLYGSVVEPDDESGDLITVIGGTGEVTLFDYSPIFEARGADGRSTTRFTADDEGRLLTLSARETALDGSVVFDQTLQFFYDVSGDFPTRVVTLDSTGEQRTVTEFDWEGDQGAIGQATVNGEVVYKR